MPAASELLTRAGTLLQDEEHVRWPLAELALWLNDGMRAVVLAKPSAKSEAVVLSLAAGTLQTLAEASHLLLLGVNANITQESPVRIRGRAVRPTTRAILDASEPNWHNPAVVKYRKEVRQIVIDEATPRQFYVYPGNDGTGKIEAVVSMMPTLIVASGEPDELGSYGAAIGLPEPYMVPLMDYVLFRAMSKDDVAGEPGLAKTYYASFAMALGIKIQVERGTNPNVAAKVAQQ